MVLGYSEDEGPCTHANGVGYGTRSLGYPHPAPTPFFGFRSASQPVQPESSPLALAPVPSPVYFPPTAPLAACRLVNWTPAFANHFSYGPPVRAEP